MDDRAWLGGTGDPLGCLHGNLREALRGPQILLVEDDDDTRDLLATLLRLAGFRPVGCRTAEEGLERLREQTFELVLTDYALPYRNGGWLLRQAGDEGLLEDTPALVVTSHPEPLDVEGHEIVEKPFDLDDLVERVRFRLEGGPRRPRRAAATAKPNRANGGDGPRCPEPIELMLYVSGHSPYSAAAIENIRNVLNRFGPGRVRLTVCDLARDPAGGAADRVAFTPTLVKRSPGPRTFILGHISNPSLVLELLESCDDGQPR